MNKIDFNYPRPTLVRDSFTSLDGIWQYKILDKNETKAIFNDFEYIKKINNTFDGDINVPFPIESKASGVAKKIPKNCSLLYYKKFTITKGDNKRLILHIGACDQKSIIYVNNRYVGSNFGGYLPIDLDITEYVTLENEICIVCQDNLETCYPYGKQSKKNSGIWYENITGIWKTVWLEEVSNNYIRNVKFHTDIDSLELFIEFEQEVEVLKDIYIYFNGEMIKKVKLSVNKCVVKFDEINLWSPEVPNLYDVRVVCENDEVTSYFGFRKISIDNCNGYKVLFLNNKPYFMHGVLDQGYFVDGIYSPTNNEVYYNELSFLKEYGFNTVRKHIKIEPSIWYYFCDKLGLIVWQDFVNNSKYSFLSDTLLPTIGLKKFKLIKCNNKNNKKIFIQESKKTVDLLFNHPSIVLWTIFNEGWGQFDTIKVYEEFKEYDKTRLFDTASGWFHCSSCKKYSDVESLHIYFKKINIKKQYQNPLVISEFGGYVYKVQEHLYSDKVFGYKMLNSIEEYNNELYLLYKRDIICNIEKGVCAAIYTQLSDVFQEINGLITFDREYIKIDKNIAIKISEEIEKKFKEKYYGETK